MSANQKIILRFYIAGITTENQEAILLFKKTLKEKLGENYSFEVIDIFEKPELAEGDKIIATPTLVRAIPDPVRQVIIDFQDQEKLLLGMDLVLKDVL